MVVVMKFPTAYAWAPYLFWLFFAPFFEGFSPKRGGGCHHFRWAARIRGRPRSDTAAVLEHSRLLLRCFFLCSRQTSRALPPNHAPILHPLPLRVYPSLHRCLLTLSLKCSWLYGFFISSYISGKSSLVVRTSLFCDFFEGQSLIQCWVCVFTKP